MAGQKELEERVAEGYDVYLIAGIGGSGKTQLLRAIEDPGFLSEIEEHEGRAAPTPPKTLKAIAIPWRGRSVLVLDAAGEEFKVLHPRLRQGGGVNPEDIEFLRLVSQRLRGVILLIDLHRLWSATRATPPEDGKQVEVLSWVLQLLRWLAHEGQYPAGATNFETHVKNRVKQMKPRLKVPVVTLFSKADELVGRPVVDDRWRVVGSRWNSKSSERLVFPAGERPMLFATHFLKPLYRTLMQHCDHFHVDFAHAVIIDPDTGGISEDVPCGVHGALDWLLDPRWQEKGNIPTRFWLKLSQVLQPGKWRQAPEPQELRR